MKKVLYTFALGTALLISTNASSQEVIKKKGFSLTFESNYAEFDPAMKQRLIETFFIVYPKLKKEYNKNTSKEVKFFVDTAYKGVAEAGGGVVRFSPWWFKKNPEDIDVVTHEVMHIVQNYGNGGGPGWLTEGIADYARFKFGVNNAPAKWALPAYKQGQSYKNAYRITAGFLNWVETKKKAGAVKILDGAMRENTYTPEIWKTLTGKTVDELWDEYASSQSA